VRQTLARLPPAVRATLSYAAGIAWNKAAGMLILPMLTVLLPPAQFGRLELLSTIAELGGLLVGAGLIDTLYRFASGPDGHGPAADVLGLAVTLGALGIAASVMFAQPLAALMPLPTSPHEIMLLGTAVSLEGMIGVPLAWLRIRGRATAFTVLTSARATAQAALAAALMAVLGAETYGLTGFLLALVVVGVAATVGLGIMQIRDTGIRFDPRRWGRLIVYVLPLVGAGAASFVLFTMDRWLLAGAVPTVELGQYGLAMRFALLTQLLVQPFDMWWSARRMAMLNGPDGRARVARAIESGSVVALVAGGLAAAVGPALIELVAPPEYQPAAAMMPFLAAVLSLQALAILASTGCYAARTGTLPMVVNGATTAVALAGYLVLIPRTGIAGAIAANLVAEAVRLTLFETLSQRRVRLTYRASRLLPLALGCVAAATVAQNVDGLAGAVLGTTVMGGVVVLAALLGLIPVPVRRLPDWAASVGRIATS